MTSPIQLYKKAYSGLSLNSWYLSLVVLINRSGTMVLPFMTIYCTQRLHFNIVQAGIIMSLFGAGSITGAFIGGKIIDKYGFYDVQVTSLISAGLFFILLGYQTTFLAICINVFILSICNDAFRPANSTAIAHYSTADNKTRSYSLNRLAVNLGWSVGGALGGFLASHNYHLLFWVDGCTNILSGLLLLKIMPRANYQKAKATIKTVNSKLSPYRDSSYLLFILFTVLFATCFFQTFTIQPIFYKTQWKINEQVIGGLMALNGLLVAFVEMVLINNLESKRHPLRYICWGVLLTGLSLTLVNWLPHTVFIAILVIVGISFGEMLAMPFMNSFWIVRTTNANRGQYAALYTMAWSTAQILAPIIGSQIIALSGYYMLWWLLGGMCVASALGFFMLYKIKFQKQVVTIKG